MANSDPTPREMFEIIGRALAPGETWQAALADLMDVKKDTIRQLRSGHLHLRLDHFATLLNLLEQRQAEMHKAETQLRQWLIRQAGDLG
jgi:hypothetical protein